MARRLGNNGRGDYLKFFTGKCGINVGLSIRAANQSKGPGCERRLLAIVKKGLSHGKKGAKV